MKLDISNRGIADLADFFTTYNGNPDEITKLYCSGNRLTTLQGCPPNVQELWCSSNLLTT